MARSERAKLGDRLLLSISTKTMFDGIEIATTDDRSTLDKVADALKLIQIHDQFRYRRLLLDLKLIWVRLLPGNLARFSPSLDACELDTRLVREYAAEFVAAAIVHEATHARLWSKGIRYDEDERLRIERACLRQEHKFASKLPHAKELLAWTEATLANPPHLSDAEATKFEETGSAEALRYRRVPEWLIRALMMAAVLLRRARRAG